MSLPAEFRGTGRNKFFQYKQIKQEGHVYLYEVTALFSGTKYYNVFRGNFYPDNCKVIRNYDDANKIFNKL